MNKTSNEPPSTQPRLAAPLEIRGFALGPFETNCYIVRVAGSRECWIIDASFEPNSLIESVRSMSVTPTRLILTHAHVDHIAGAWDIRRAFPGIRIAIHPSEREWLQDPMKNLSFLSGMSITSPDADDLLDHGTGLTLPGLTPDQAAKFDVLHTPGHSPGGITLSCPSHRLAFVGDTLFAGSIGRTDFPGGNPRTLADSIRSVLYTLDPATRVLPGHGPETTIAREMASNPYVPADRLA